ncbi:Glycosyl hydrolases related to GH101 family, GHL1-GHL3 [Dyella sp. OK004]|uniref:glycoside hydrolase n=1 Tax=Dyella sp. OK004 TaxID=1855292 RepID=UPI0008E98EF1|nr:glycoside hydrolase [Dyella sp. OK004]SFS08358.1 Glycosyl hydrolases related to GH101 family, GHL1-GHL3 [Dyella sp. OK004]
MFHRVCRLIALCVVTAPSLTLADTVLENSQWQVALEPGTLAIRVTPARGATVTASAGVSAHAVSQFTATTTHADWQWDNDAYRIEVALEGGDLALSIRAKATGELDFLRQPGSAMGQGLIFPLAEGHYVPRGNALWQRFMIDRMGEINTAQDLSLPLWGNDHGNFSLTWLLTNPFNNQLKFTADGDALAIAASHQFTRLDPGTPLTLLLHLGDADPLAGAKRYRQWLIDTGRFESLESKLVKTPEIDKLLGATHVYLWGSGLLAVKDVKDWSGLLRLLRGKHAFAVDLASHFDAEASAVLKQTKATPDRYGQRVLVTALNQALNAKARARWFGDEPDMHVLADSYGDVRQQLSVVFGSVLEQDASRWGSGISMATMQQLQAAGLSHLWLGLGEGWEGGLWHPEAIAAAVRAGYLIGPYDSYETALFSKKENPDWATAHLGLHAYKNCAIVLANGKPKAGFQQSGYYTDPRCVRPLLEARVTALLKKVPFNSWFLDVYATAMVFDSYRPGATMTEQQNAAGYIDSMRWLTEKLHLPIGSEDGNGPTSQGFVFAHGMQTPVMGWGDPDLGSGPKKNKQSPYYLGDWFPGDEPTVFFKSVPMKEPYRTAYFDPVFRLPLYQAVFHGSIIATHHWVFDNLKLSNVHVESELTQLLYNAPPLYHLSADTLSARLPLMKRQDAFFQPLHRALATQALTGLQWLSSDRRLQQTTFADGTRLIANFADASREVAGKRYDAHSITAIRTDGSITRYVPDADVKKAP